MSLKGKVALVTGGSRGIGAAISERLAQDGATVIVNYVSNSSAADAAVQKINSLGGIGKAIKADVGNLDDSKKMIEEVAAEFGKIDFLILNAGIMPMVTLENVTEADYAKVLDANVKGPMFLTKFAAPHISEGGRVLFFSSNLTIGTTFHAGYLLYMASKGAVEQIARVLARDPVFVNRKITVNVVSPGPTATDMFLTGKPDELISKIKMASPLNDLGKPEHIASVVRFLCSEESSWVHSQNWRVNGGIN